MDSCEKRDALQNKLYPLIFQPAIWRHLLKVNEISPEKPEAYREYDQDANEGSEAILLPNSIQKGGNGESEAHNALKKYIIEHCEEIENLRLLGCETDKAEVEHLLPSMDRPDVFFRNNGFSVACEIKSWQSDDADLLRGIFQCVKYKALLDAVSTLEGHQDANECILIVQNDLPEELQTAANRLHVPHIRLSRRKVGN